MDRPFPLSDTELDEFMKTIERPIMGRRITFQQWLALRGVDPKTVATDHEFGDFIGQTVFQTPNRTRRQKGRETAIANKVFRRNELIEDYVKEIPKEQVGTRPLRLDMEADRAYARIRYRRLNKLDNYQYYEPKTGDANA